MHPRVTGQLNLGSEAAVVRVTVVRGESFFSAKGVFPMGSSLCLCLCDRPFRLFQMNTPLGVRSQRTMLRVC